MSYKEYFHNEIEHEPRNENQGKRKDHLHYAAKLWFWANVIFFILVILWVLFGLKEY